jgi:hypothetical protein
VFKPDKSIPESLGLLERGKPILIRIIDFQAIHDWRYRKFKDNYDKILKDLEKDYEIVLSIEGKSVPKKWRKYVYEFKPLEYHHILAHSKLYIGSGSTTAAEGAMLGIPSIYTNPQNPGYIHWLEQNYGIVNSVTENSFIVERIQDILKEKESKWKKVRKRILKDTTNVPLFIENLIKREIKIFKNRI